MFLFFFFKVRYSVMEIKICNRVFCSSTKHVVTHFIRRYTVSLSLFMFVRLTQQIIKNKTKQFKTHKNLLKLITRVPVVNNYIILQKYVYNSQKYYSIPFRPRRFEPKQKQLSITIIIILTTCDCEILSRAVNHKYIY